MKATVRGVKIKAFTVMDKEFNINIYLKHMLQRQDLEAWKKTPKDFDIWIKNCIKQRIDMLDFIIN